MLILGLGMFILLIGWFGFNAARRSASPTAASPRSRMVTMLGAAGGILGASSMTVGLQRTVDIGMVCNGLIAGLVAITAPSGYVENWAAPIIGLVGGLIVVPSIMLIERKLDDPSACSRRTASPASGARRAGCSRAALRAVQRIGNPDGGLYYSGSFAQLRPGARRGRRVRDGDRGLA